MKVRHLYPAGQASASKIKALLLCLESRKGATIADDWLKELRLARTDLDDETRLLPLKALHNAAIAFVKLVPEGIEAIGPYLVIAENLGVWARVLRGTRAPEEAFSRIDAADSEHGRTSWYETIEGSRGRWRGRVRTSHDPALETDGLLGRMRQVELSMVPTLFGFARAKVDMGAKTDDTQEFEVRWSLANPNAAAMLGAAGGAAVGGLALLQAPTAVGGIVALLGPVLCGIAGFAFGRGQISKVEASAQAMRVSALERSLVLRDTEDRGGAGDLEGNVVAGQYRIGQRMGSGASGAVYEAARLTDGLPVAIKLLRAATAHDAVASDRLRREAEALGLSWHPNVVEVIDHGHLPDGTSYLVMELLRGETLALRLKFRHRLSPEEVLPIAQNVADALVAIHAAGVVHRDLKPANIYLVKDDDGSEKAKILDFGIARVEWEEMRITNMGAPLGTPGYMSPEQERGQEVDARSDVYAIGAVIYECFVGEPPPPSAGDMWKPGRRPPSSIGLRLPSEDGIETAGNLTSGVHPASRRSPSAAPAPAEVPEGWRRLVERALSKSPDDRYQDARTMLAEIRGLAADTPAVATS